MKPEVLPSAQNPALRNASNEDSEKIKNLVFTILREYKLKTDPEKTDLDLQDIEMNYVKRGGLFDLLETNDKKIIGCVGLYPLNKERCELRKMYLDKEYRGRGLGKKLLEHSLSSASRLGFSEVVLETASVLKEAIQLYESYGFNKFNTEELSSRCDQSYILKL